LVGLARSNHRYQPTKNGQAALRMRLKELAETRVHYGYRRLHILLRRESSDVNAKRIYRIYPEEKLSLRTKRPKRRVSCRTRIDRPEAAQLNDCWANFDFMSDELFDGRQIRLLTIVDHFTRESVAIAVGQRMRGREVVEVLEQVACNRKLPKTIRVDNGPEFTSKELDQWAYANRITLDFSGSGKPTDNAFIESFNRSVRAECLNENWFMSLDDAKEKIDAWRLDCNEHRPNSALGNLAPEDFASSGRARPAR
jgi:putative transposase